MSISTVPFTFSTPRTRHDPKNGKLQVHHAFIPASITAFVFDKIEMLVGGINPTYSPSQIVLSLYYLKNGVIWGNSDANGFAARMSYPMHQPMIGGAFWSMTLPCMPSTFILDFLDRFQHKTRLVPQVGEDVAFCVNCDESFEFEATFHMGGYNRGMYELTPVEEDEEKPRKPEPECKCPSLLFGHLQTCPLWRKS